jgi:hypothetical protein
MTETMPAEGSLDFSVPRVRRATVADLSVVVELRLALLREYAHHPVYGRLHEDVESRARPVFEQQIKATDQAIFLSAMARSPVLRAPRTSRDLHFSCRIATATSRRCTSGRRIDIRACYRR